MPHRRLLSWLAIVIPLGVFLGVYLPRIGHGFLLDDFRWILESRIRSLADVSRLLHADNGFYRPVVALTFGVNEWLAGTHPFGYALVNLLLALACAGAIGALARAFGLSRGAVVLAAMAWLFNMHATREGLMWISGRTSLLVTLAAVLAARAVVRWRPGVALLWLVVALFSKEDGVLVAGVLIAWLAILNREDLSRAVVRTAGWAIPAAGAVGLYLAMRASTHAMTPATAPDYYRFDFSPALVLRNAGEYLDRGATVAALIVTVAILTLGWTRPLADRRLRTILSCGAVWFGGTLCLALVMPARSDLYAMLPAVGACVIAAAIVDHCWQAASPVRRARALAAAALLPLVLAPVYWARTTRAADRAVFSTRTLAELDRLTSSLPDGTVVTVLDDPEARSERDALTIDNVFGGLVPDAIELTTGRRLTIRVQDEDDGEAPLVLALRRGALQVVASRAPRIASATAASSTGSTVRRSINTAASWIRATSGLAPARSRASSAAAPTVAWRSETSFVGIADAGAEPPPVVEAPSITRQSSPATDRSASASDVARAPMSSAVSVSIR